MMIGYITNWGFSIHRIIYRLRFLFNRAAPEFPGNGTFVLAQSPCNAIQSFSFLAHPLYDAALFCLQMREGAADRIVNGRCGIMGLSHDDSPFVGSDNYSLREPSWLFQYLSTCCISSYHQPFLFLLYRNKNRLHTTKYFFHRHEMSYQLCYAEMK